MRTHAPPGSVPPGCTHSIVSPSGAVRHYKAFGPELEVVYVWAGGRWVGCTPRPNLLQPGYTRHELTANDKIDALRLAHAVNK